MNIVQLWFLIRQALWEKLPNRSVHTFALVSDGADARESAGELEGASAEWTGGDETGAGGDVNPLR